MAFMPGATRLGPIPAGNYSNQVCAKIGTVTHVVVGSASSAIAEFMSNGSQLSAHFVIAGPGDPAYTDGQIIQVLDTDFVAYAQSAGNWPPTSYIAKEFGGDVNTPMSAAQLESSAQVDAWASKVHAFPLVGVVEHGTPGITTHCHPNGQPDPAWGNHTCPGPIRLAQVPGVIARAKQIVAPNTDYDDPETEILMSLAANPDDALFVYIRDKWALYRSDPLTLAARGYLYAGYHGPWNGSLDFVLACIIDTASASGHLRPQFAGAV